MRASVRVDLAADELPGAVVFVMTDRENWTRSLEHVNAAERHLGVGPMKRPRPYTFFTLV
ncbi:MAG: hypothetical protein IT193_20255 [Propionibacteriaceae bacterium]|nr:hypothetical protein [Propionibacteriaceae bacterium]